MRRWLLVGISVFVALGLVVGGVVVFLTPDHRTTFLVDASESSDFREVADAVGAAASNMSSDDSLALRRFGGACDSANTAELVAPGIKQAAKIGDAARSITPSGKATLLSGILAAIDDFTRTYPFRGSQTNRIVVVARGGADACGKSADEVRTIIKERVSTAGVKIDFRFVGHRLTQEQFKVLSDIAAATEAQTPRLTKTSEELVTTLKEVSIPANLVAQPVTAPTACDFVTLETLEAAHPQKIEQGPEGRYLGFKCYQGRYLLARAKVTHPSLAVDNPDGTFVLFEFRDQAWQHVESTTRLRCSKAPQEAWRQWGDPCDPDPVVCREGPDKVVDANGAGCPAAIDIADRYLAWLRARPPGSLDTFWTSGEWGCSAAAPVVQYGCSRRTDDRIVEIGE